MGSSVDLHGRRERHQKPIDPTRLPELEAMYAGLKAIQPRLQYLLRRYNYASWTVDDLIVETYLKLARTSVRYDHNRGASLSTFLQTVAKRILIDHVRKLRKDYHVRILHEENLGGWGPQQLNFPPINSRIVGILREDVSERDRIVAAAVYGSKEIERTLSSWGCSVLRKFREETGIKPNLNRAKLAVVLRVSREALDVRIHRLRKRLIST
jgi:DNA-directed RNA polymerase specialized sigma24 family protein